MRFKNNGCSKLRIRVIEMLNKGKNCRKFDIESYTRISCGPPSWIFQTSRGLKTFLEKMFEIYKIKRKSAN